MGNGQVAPGGHACIVVGGAQEEFARTGKYVQVTRLVELWRQEGVPEEYLQYVVVMLHSPDTALGDGGGLYQHGAKLRCSATPKSPERVFTLVLHATVNGSPQLPFTLLHEAGHAWAFTRGKGGRVLYTAVIERWLRRVSLVMLFCLAALWVAIVTQPPVPLWAYMFIAGSAVLFMCAAKMPYMVLWLLSSAEWKANWFYWRHRKIGLVSDISDGTEVLHIEEISIERS